MKKTLKIISILFCSILLITGCGNNSDNNDSEIKEEPKPQLKIVDINSNSRSYAVMINNHASARKNHAGLQDAYLVYEMIVEGGITRYMAIFKDQDTSKIGSIRSSRPYYLDYVMENDAIYVHWGWSPQAQSDISKYSINNINGLYLEGKYFFRDKTLNVAYEHTGFSSIELLKKAATGLNYRTTTDKDLLLNYSVEEILLNDKENTQVANNVKIVYSSYVNTSYVYDSTNKVYKRYVNGAVHKDAVTGEQYTAKNIITYQVKNSVISNDDKGRQEFENIGSGEGYYITNGYATKIKWEKTSRQSQTVYKYLDGTEINVNDGNTYIQIQPKSQVLTISE